MIKAVDNIRKWKIYRVIKEDENYSIEYNEYNWTTIGFYFRIVRYVFLLPKPYCDWKFVQDDNIMRSIVCRM